MNTLNKIWLSFLIILPALLYFFAFIAVIQDEFSEATFCLLLAYIIGQDNEKRE